MSLTNQLKKICTSLGKNNNPAYAVMAIAAVKGICRPTFTMMDKKEKPETKKYTALREGLTEAIAIPSYFGCSMLAAQFSKAFKDEKSKTLAKKNLMFLGVCAAALVIIPGLCSIVIKPFMKLIMPNKNINKQEENKFDTGSTKNFQGNLYLPMNKANNLTQLNNFPRIAKPQTGMKVGAV